MKKIIFLLTLITFIFLISDSCKKKCESNNLGNVSFSPTDLQIVPYNGTEKLTFSDSLGNSLEFTGTTRVSYFEQDNYQFPSNDPNACQGDYFYSEGNETEFQGVGNNSFLWLTLSIEAGTPFHQYFVKYISIFLNFNDIEGWKFNCSFIFNNLQLQNSSGGGGSVLSYNDTLKIGPKKFYSVYILTQVIPTDGNLLYVFYTIKEGVVGFKEQTGKRLYLNN